MCIIIERDRKIILPEDKFISAYINNNHGWGLSVPDEGGLLHTIKKVPPQDSLLHDLKQEAKELYDLLHTEFRDDKLLLHLRYNTAGKTNLRNAHPFPILEKDSDGIDLRMAHNGTISNFKPAHYDENSWESDTRVFVRKVVRPLFKRLIKAFSPQEILKDEFVTNLLEELIPYTSVLSFIDGEGNSLQINPLGNGGRYYDGWWCSNEYSFEDAYRTPSNKTTNRYGYTANNNVSSNHKNSSVIPLLNNDKDHAMDTKTERFSDVYDIKDPEELYSLSDDWIDLIYEEKPEHLILLIKELLNDNYILNRANKNLAKKLKKLEKGK